MTFTKKLLIFLSLPFFLTLFWFCLKPKEQKELIVMQFHEQYSNDKKTPIQNSLSILGKILYLNETVPMLTNPNVTYQVLYYKYGKLEEDPFEQCSVKNCEFTLEDKALETADLVIFHMHRMKAEDLPSKRGKMGQIWTFMTDESPYNLFMHRNNIKAYNGVFNWSMTYRSDSDIPVPYGRKVLRQSKNVVSNKSREVLVSAMGSNCGGNNHRWQYVKELQKYIKVDFYGHCGTLECPGHFFQDCHKIDKYPFFLAFENSNCAEYLTEKVWWNAYHKNSIPVVMGASREDCERLLPPNSYIHVEDFSHPKDLAQYLLNINETNSFQEFFEWKQHYDISNEHHYFGSKSQHFCRVCEALNYNDKTFKVYDDLAAFWSVKRDCRPPWDVNF